MAVHRLAFATFTIESRRCFPFAIVALMVALSQAAQAQPQKSKEAQKDDAITLKTHLVTLDVIVKDDKGKYITDMKREDFTVLENGVRQTTEFFDPPLSGGEPNHPGADPKRAI